MLNRSKSDKGVTLIALVITIAVLLILAGVSITAITDDSGILSRTNELSESANTSIEQNTQELNNMTNELDYVMNPWVQNKTEVTKKLKSGTVTLNVGDNYTYDCGVEGYTGAWKVLGAENGKLLIMSTVNVGTLTLEGKNGYNNGISKLSEMCEPYGRNARSITVEDINRVTGYNPTNQGDGTIYGAGEFWKYGSEVTYTASGSSTTNGNTYTGSITYEHPDERKIGSNGVTSITVKNTYYSYYPYLLTTSNSTTGECKGIPTSSPAYEMIFGKATDTSASSGNNYWLASSYVYSDNKGVSFGIRSIYPEGRMGGCRLWRSNRGVDSDSCGVRAVVPID